MPHHPFNAKNSSETHRPQVQLGMALTANSSSNGDSNVPVNLVIVLNSVSFAVCLLASILVLCIKLYKLLVYRLALYQTLAALTLTADALFNAAISRNFPAGPLCVAVAWFSLYSQWMKLLFTIWLTFHLFCFAVLHKNLKKLEMLYVATSLLIPAAVAVVPLTTHTYGHSPLGCYIHGENNGTIRVALIQRYALWEVPAIAILVAASLVMVVMVIKLVSRVCWRFKYEPIIDGDTYWKALKQLLPLAAFPILFLIFLVPVSVYSFSAEGPTVNAALRLTAAICFPLWSMASGLTLIIHITVACLCRNIKIWHQVTHFTPSRAARAHVTTQASSTHFSPQHEDDS